MSDKKHWISKLVPALAFAAGIIIASVGGIMTISSSLKLVFFDTNPYSYIDKDQCRYYYDRYPQALALDLKENSSSDNIEPHQRTEIEFEKCMEEKLEEEKDSFQKNQLENIVEGVSALIVGGVLLLAFRKRK